MRNGLDGLAAGGGSPQRRGVLLEAARAIEAWGWERRWVGPDPYDALNGSRVPVPRSMRGRRIVIQAVKRSPVDLRGPLGIAPRRDSAAVAHVLSAYARGSLPIDERSRLQRVDWCIEQLAGMRTAFSAESSWGYHFDVATRFFFYPETMPNTIATAFAGLALLDAHGAGRTDVLPLAESAGRFLLESVGQTPGEGGAFFGYFPGDRSPIHNANLLACRLLARLLTAGVGGRQAGQMSEAVGAGVGFALAHQRPDGSWPYAETASGEWVDGLHTGYVLDALLDCAPVLDPALRERTMSAWRRGIDLYAKALFDPDGAPRFTAARRHPIDGQNVAQAIETFARASTIDPGRLDRAWRTFDFALRRMRRVDGAFVFQRHRLWVNRVPHVRWVQAPMLAALSSLLDARDGREAGRIR